MKVMLHSYKGYLNTEFHIFAEGGTQKYTIYPKSGDPGESILTGLVNANTPHAFKLSQPGEFTVAFENGTKSDILIEDGYKFGGSSLKKAFIFDNCPWAFIIMHDRTFFYNRDTEQEYVEPISPDNIIEVSKDFVIFENSGVSEKSLFSLVEQKPILCIQNIVSFNQETLVWVECPNEHSNEYIVKIYSLTSKEVTTNIHTSSYCVDEKCRNLFFVEGKDIKSYPLSLQEGTSAITFEYDGDFAAFIEGQIAVSHIKSQSVIFLYNLSTGEKIGSIEYEGVLAELNNTVFADIEMQRQAIYKFNLEEGGFIDCNIEGKFTKLHIYPCAWNVFYVSTITDLFKSKLRYSCETHSYLKSMNNPEVKVTLKEGSGHFYSQGDAICFYNGQESFVTSKNYSGSGYCDSGDICISKSGILKKESNSYTILSKNGYWDHRIERDIDVSYYKEFALLKEEPTGRCMTLKGRKLGKWSCMNMQYEPYIATDSCRIYKGGHILNSKKYPMFITSQMKYGLDINKSGVILYQYSNEKDILEKRILGDIFDTSKYKDVLLSESGDEILYRTEDGTSVMNVKTGAIHSYDNLSYVKHTNGIRPLFSTPASLQPRVINPVIGQVVNCEELTKLQFVSPDRTLYADTRLKEYVEYYFIDTQRLITAKEHKSLYDKYQYPWGEKRGSTNWKKVKQNRIEFVLEHFDLLNRKYPKLFNNTKKPSRWRPSVIDDENVFGTAHFLERVF